MSDEHTDEIKIMTDALKANGVESFVVRPDLDRNTIIVPLGTPESAALIRQLLNHLIGDELGTIN